MNTRPDGSGEPPCQLPEQSADPLSSAEEGASISELTVEPALLSPENQADPDLQQRIEELERRLAGSLPRPSGPDDQIARDLLLDALGRPASSEGYVIRSPNDLVTADPKINERLHAAGFTGDQAQLVYDLAAEFLVPLVGELRSELRAERELHKLRAHFGGEREWTAMAEQLRTWGQANLDPETYLTLSSTAEGIEAMLQIMRSREPQLASPDDDSASALDESALYEMMRDPRYWRSHDPEFIARVTAGFERLFSR
jgi:hypothetical protein